MARARPGLIGAIILVLTVWLGQGASALVASPDRVSHETQLLAGGDALPVLEAALPSWDDPGDDLILGTGPGLGIAPRAEARRTEFWRIDAARRPARPRSTGPPGETPPA